MIRSVLTATVAALAGLVSALAGTSVHRALEGWGMAVAIGLVLTGAVFVRAWANWIGLASFATAVFIVIGIFAGPGPGDSVLIAEDQAGYVLLIGASLAALLPAAIPGRWVSTTSRHAVALDETVTPPTSA